MPVSHSGLLFLGGHPVYNDYIVIVIIGTLFPLMLIIVDIVLRAGATEFSAVYDAAAASEPSRLKSQRSCWPRRIRSVDGDPTPSPAHSACLLGESQLPRRQGCWQHAQVKWPSTNGFSARN